MPTGDSRFFTDSIELGELLARLAAESGISNREVCKRAGIKDDGIVSRLRKGRRCSPKVALALLKVFNRDVESLPPAYRGAPKKSAGTECHNSAETAMTFEPGEQILRELLAKIKLEMIGGRRFSRTQLAIAISAAKLPEFASRSVHQIKATLDEMLTLQRMNSGGLSCHSDRASAVCRFFGLEFPHKEWKSYDESGRKSHQAKLREGQPGAKEIIQYLGGFSEEDLQAIIDACTNLIDERVSGTEQSIILDSVASKTAQSIGETSGLMFSQWRAIQHKAGKKGDIVLDLLAITLNNLNLLARVLDHKHPKQDWKLALADSMKN